MPLEKSSPRSENRCKFPFPAMFLKVTRREVDDDLGRIYVTIRGYGDREAAVLAASPANQNGPMPDEQRGYVFEDRVSIKSVDLPAIDPKAEDPQLDQIERYLLTLPLYATAKRV
jgi:hypothetical protein